MEPPLYIRGRSALLSPQKTIPDTTNLIGQLIKLIDINPDRELKNFNITNKVLTIRRKIMAETEIEIPADRQEIITRRTFRAPRDQVYKILTDPNLIPEWWGPRSLQTEVEKMEVRPGGLWRFIQRDTEGKLYAFHGVYHTTKTPELLIYTMEWEGLPNHVLIDYERFVEEEGLTICTSRSVFETMEDRDGMLRQGMEGGFKETSERIDAILKKIGMGGRQTSVSAEKLDGRSITITRIFKASPEQVWREWSDPENYKCWFGPKDYSTCKAEIDMHVGGNFFNCIVGPDGKQIYSTGRYKEIVEPNRFVCSDSFADEYGNIVPATYYGMSADIPLEMEVDVTLEDVGGKTRLTLEHCGLPTGEIRENTTRGWNEAFNKLEECLA
jgi:uncharacterized protein YndB with AHSA1/START domain